MIQVLPDHLQAIRTHAESIYPEECCGILLGYLADEMKVVVELIPTENAWSPDATDGEMGKERRYTIAPQAMLNAQKDARLKSLNIIGIYHSHPNYPATPSECDRVCAWQQYSYIIVSVIDGQAGDLYSWCLDDAEQFQMEAIVNGN